MAQESLADKVVSWAIYAIRAVGTLPFDLQVVPFVSGDTAENERLIVKCETGVQMDSGPQPFECVLTFDFKTVKRSDTDANDVFAKVEAALTVGLNNADAIDFAETLFTWLQIFTENAETNTEHSQNFRRYTRTIPLRASAA